jgi:hypothetical protein
MKKLITLLFTPLFVVSAFAQTRTETKTEITLVSSDARETVIKFRPGSTVMKTVDTPQGQSVIIATDKGTPILKAGAPDLEKLTTSVIIPDAGSTAIEIVSTLYHDIPNVLVAPSKGNLYRNQDPASVPFTYGEAYSKNQFYPSSEAEVRSPYIVRDYRGQAVMAYAFRYNPVTKVLRVYDEIVVKIKSMPGVGINELTRIDRVVPAEFDGIYHRQFLNYAAWANQGGPRYTPLDEQGEMLIICHGPFMASMNSFVLWKNMRGIKTTMVDVATVGNNATSIKSYIANFYNNNNLAFVLLVGDAPEVAASLTSYGPSDNDYAFISGSDHYPEILIGRFSAESAQHVATMVTRTLEYERNPQTGTWYTENIGIGSDQGPGDDNEMDYEHERNIGNLLLSYNYTNFHEIYDGSQGGSDAAGNPGPTDVATPVNAGIGIINYTGHGSAASWGTTSFSTTDVDGLTNTHKWPFIFSVACVNGDFTASTCFAEYWLRAKNPATQEPTGAVCTIMSTINQSWNPPMEGQDEMNAILAETVANNIRRTFAGITMNGCMQMNDAYGTAGDEMTDTWTIFGDPSLMVRTLNPLSMTVTHNPTMFLGATQFTVNCNVNNAAVTLYQAGQIIGTGTVSGGNVTMNFANAISTLDTVWVTAVEYNYIPYTGYVLVTPASGPYVVQASVQLQDPTGNNDNLADYNENIDLDVTLQNVGIVTANQVTAVLSTTDTYVSITDNTELYGDIAASSTQLQTSAYAFSVANNVPDQHVVPFTLTISDTNNNTWTASFNVTVKAPNMTTGALSVDDAAANNNAALDPAETVNILIPTGNNGNSNSPVANGTLTTTSPYITINNGSAALGVINVAGTTNAIFSITVSPTAPIGATVDLIYNVTAGAYTASTTYLERIGIAQETYETNTLTLYPWATSGNAVWFTTTNNAFDGQYCTESGNISGNQTSVLSITMNVTATDSVSFWYAVSSEQDYDFLQFRIDNTILDQWSGAVNWDRAAFPVTAGNHTLKWTYMKDQVASSGQDCAWLDDVTFPPFTTGVAVSEQTSTTDYGVYPNPSTGPVTFFWHTGEQSDVQLVIYDASGRIVQTPYSVTGQAAGQYAYNWSAEGMAAGIYFAHIIVNGNDSVMKIIVQ